MTRSDFMVLLIIFVLLCFLLFVDSLTSAQIAAVDFIDLPIPVHHNPDLK